MQRKENYAVFGFLAILLLQVVMMFYFCANKQEYHIDEIYSYILSNSYHCDNLSNANDIKNHWISGKDSFPKFVSVQTNERFAYHKTYLNNTTDAHPPFYYFILHTVCSFFPDRFSKWFGLSINIIAFVLSQILLFLISRELFNGLIWQLLPMALYGFSPIAVDIVLYIRMYSVLVLFTLLLFFVHLNMLEGKLQLPYLWCFLITFLGVFTQYFFAFSAFYLALFYCVFLWKNKKFRDLLYYSVSMISGVLLVFLVYPAAFRQTTGSSTNNVGNEVSSNFLNIAMLPERLSSYRVQFTRRMILNWKWRLFYTGVLCMILIFAAILRNKKSKKSNIIFTQNPVNVMKNAFKHKKTMYVFMTAMIMLLTVSTVAHISGKFSYLRYLYNIMPIIFFLFVAMVYYLSYIFNINRAVLSAGFVFFAFIIGTEKKKKKNCEYLFEGRHRVICDTVSFLNDKPLVLLDKNTTHVLTGNFTLLSSVDRLYITDTDDVDIDELTVNMDVSDGVAFLVIDNTEWSEGYIGDDTVQKMVDLSENFNTYEKYGEQLHSTMYWVH